MYVVINNVHFKQTSLRLHNAMFIDVVICRNKYIGMFFISDFFFTNID